MAGGDIIDVVALSKAGIHRKERKVRILRSWRLQATFAWVSLAIPIASTLIIQVGLPLWQTSWVDLQDLAQDVDALGFRGLQVLSTLSRRRETVLQFPRPSQLLLFQPLEQQQQQLNSTSLNNEENSSMSSWCPALTTADNLHLDQQNRTTTTTPQREQIGQLAESMLSLETKITDIQDFLKEENVLLNSANDGFEAMVEASGRLQELVDEAYDNDWILKFVLLVWNLLAMVLLGAVLILSKHQIIHAPTRCYLAYFIVPLFAAGLVAMVTLFGFFHVGLVANSDLCMGGPATEAASPTGTIEDAIMVNLWNSMDRSSILNKMNDDDASSLIYDSFQYYAKGCMSEFPLEEMSTFAQVELVKALGELSILQSSLTIELDDGSTGVEALGRVCRTDLSQLPRSVQQLEQELSDVLESIEAMIDLTGCNRVSSVLRRVTHGSLCQESINGLSWIWSCWLVMIVAGCILLTTRAALYNQVKTKEKSAKKKEQQRVKEFDEYRSFMLEYYPDADGWKLDTAPSKTHKAKIEFDDGVIVSVPTYDTQSTGQTSETTPSPTASSSQDDGVGIEVELDVDVRDKHPGELRLPKEQNFFAKGNEKYDEADDASSNASIYSSDSDCSDGQDTTSSFSFIVGSVSSAAMQTIRSFRALPPLLTKRKHRKQDDPLNTGFRQEDISYLGDESDCEDSFLCTSICSSRQEDREKQNSYGSERLLGDDHESADDIDEEDILDPDYITPTSATARTFSSWIGQALTPTAPRKAMQYLSRTTEEMEPLTPVHPRQLRLSPFAEAPKRRPKTPPSPSAPVNRRVERIAKRRKSSVVDRYLEALKDKKENVSG